MGRQSIGPVRTMWWALCLLLMVGALGCGEPKTSDETAAGQRNMTFLARFYGRYQAMSRGVLPPSEEAFRKFLAMEQIAEEVKGTGITNIEDLFVSPRDKQKYVIQYKTRPNNPGLNNDPIFAYEAVGVDGKRFAASLSGAVEELDAEQFKAAVPDAK
ncbi:MAG: hypothetical protein U0795_04230 [Pirellulales bacterium]